MGEYIICEWLCCSDDWLLAKRALEFYFKPVIDALTVEFVWARESLHHLARFELINTDRTVWLVLFLTATSSWFFVFEGCVWINHSSNLILRKLSLLIWLVLELLLLIHLLLFFIIRRVIITSILMLVIWVLVLWLLLLIGKGVPVKVHLDVLLRNIMMYVVHHLRNISEEVWEVGETILCIISHVKVRGLSRMWHGSLRETRESVATKVKLEVLVLSVCTMTSRVLLLLLTSVSWSYIEMI